MKTLTKTLQIILALMLVGLSQVSLASVDILQQRLKANEMMTDVRNDANLWQGYLHIGNDEKVVFHALIDDGKITWWNEDVAGKGTDYSENGQIADSATTVVGMLAGAAEMNPLGIFVLPAKYLMNEHAESLGYEECKVAKASMGASGYGAAASNVVSLLTGGFSPLSMIAGIIAADKTYEKSLAEAYCELWAGPVVKNQINAPMLDDNQYGPENSKELLAQAEDYTDADEYEL